LEGIEDDNDDDIPLELLFLSDGSGGRDVVAHGT